MSSEPVNTWQGDPTTNLCRNNPHLVPLCSNIAYPTWMCHLLTGTFSDIYASVTYPCVASIHLPDVQETILLCFWDGKRLFLEYFQHFVKALGNYQPHTHQPCKVLVGTGGWFWMGPDKTLYPPNALHSATTYGLGTRN